MLTGTASLSQRFAPRIVEGASRGRWASSYVSVSEIEPRVLAICGERERAGVPLSVAYATLCRALRARSSRDPNGHAAPLSPRTCAVAAPWKLLDIRPGKWGPPREALRAQCPAESRLRSGDRNALRRRRLHATTPWHAAAVRCDDASACRPVVGRRQDDSSSAAATQTDRSALRTEQRPISTCRSARSARSRTRGD
jgi:hypothetical protein